MDGLLHWDFSPGLAPEAQVHRLFGSPVTPPSSSSSEFFLVVSFSSASFALSEESVALALQCCLGGLSRNFRVFKLSDHRFRFSVASNKVGHFIYHLRDRVWPDFVCHFSLFRGVIPTGSSRFSSGVGWSSSVQNIDIAQRSYMKINPNLDFLRSSAIGDGSSKSELAKFGFVHNSSEGLSFGSFPAIKLPRICKSSSSSSSSSDFIQFGSFLDPIMVGSAVTSQLSQHSFLGRSFFQNLCLNLPRSSLEDIEDLRSAGYADQVIMESLNIPAVPPKELVFSVLGRCSCCSLSDHLRQNCPGVCLSCQKLGFKCSACIGPSCSRCLEHGHISANCSVGLRCWNCKGLGHRVRYCFAVHKIQVKKKEISQNLRW